MKSFILVLALTALLALQTASAQKTDQQITFSAIPQKAFGSGTFSLEATATSGLSITFVSSNVHVATISGSIVTIVGAGECIIIASQSGNEAFNPASDVSQSLIVFKASQTIVFDALPPKTFGESAFLLFASSTSGLPISYSSSNTTVATVTGNMVTIVGAGESIITAIQPGNNNYEAAEPVGRTLIVNKAEQTISFSALPSKTYGDAPFTLPASATSGLPVQYVSNNPGLVSISGNVATIHGAGEVQITASQPGNTNYFAAGDVVQVLIVKRAPQIIAFNTIPTKTYGNPPFPLIAISTSGLLVSFSSQYDSLITILGNMATIVGAGTVKIFATQPGNENFLPKTVEQTVIINKAPQTITFNALPAKKFGDKPFTLSATATSGLPVLFSSNRKTVAKVSGVTVTIVGAGTAPIVASQSGNANYLAAVDVIQPLVVTALGNSYPIVGITRTGGNGRGTIFSVNTNGSDFTIQKNFGSNAFNSPQSGLIKGSDGKLYGMIMAGGSPSNGVVFSINPDGSQYTILHNFNFTTGQRPFGNVMEASNGYLYGMTYDGGVNNTGVLFRIKKDGTDFSKLYEFPNAGINGYHPLGGLIESPGGDLYGMTAEGPSYGVVFSIKLDGTGYTKLLELNGTTRGGSPRGDLLLSTDQYLYGLATRGGSSNLGVLFKVKTDGSNYSNVVEFDGASKGSIPGATLIMGADGKLYGMTQTGGVHDKGTIFSVNTNGSAFTKLFDFDGTNTGGWVPGSLVQSSADGYLYGMTNQGGSADLGVAFKIKTDGTDFTKLIDFTGPNGASPVFGPLLEGVSGTFYGMTSKGGSSNVGLIFSLTSSGSITKLKEFPQPEGTPELISSSDGNEYFGIASSGGPTGNGTIFKTAANGGGYEKVHDLEGNVLYVNRLLKTSDNVIWGAGNEGVFTVTSILFRLNGDGSNFQRVSFAGAPGLAVGQLIEGPDQFIYGTGYVDGSPNGIIFRFKANGTNFTKLADIPGGSLGSHPTENLVLTEDGNLFGLMHEGGANNMGAVFKFNINTFQYARIFSLQSTTGTYPKQIALLNGSSLCIATAVGGANNSGTLFTISMDGNDYSKIFDFGSGTATGPTDIIQTVDGYLIGSTEYGGASNSGILYEILPDGSAFKKIVEFTGTNGSIPKSLHFRKTEQVITFPEPGSRPYNNPPFALGITNNSNLPVVLTSSDESIVTIEDGIATIHGVGQVTITANAPGNVNFSPAQTVQRTLIITKATQVITFPDPGSKPYTNPPFALGISNSSDLPLTVTSSDESIIRIENDIATIHGVGEVIITASTPGNINYLPASVARTLTITKIDQTITFDAVTDVLLGSGTITLSGTSTSGLPVEFSESSDHVSLTNGTLTLLSAGTVTIHANQPGNSFYSAAPQSSQTFCINPVKPVIAGESLSLSSNYSTGNQWYKNGHEIIGETSSTITVTESGSYAVAVTMDGCSSLKSDARIVVITALDENQTELKIYPNPVQEKLMLDLTTYSNQSFEIQIIDLSGRVMKKVTGHASLIEIRVGDLPTGSYILKANTGSHQVTAHFVKN